MQARRSSGVPSPYTAEGSGLQIAAPKASTGFTVHSIQGRRLRASDLKLSIRGSAIVKPEVAENEDGSLQVTYVAPMSGEYKITMSIGPSAVGNSPYRVPCQQPRPSDVESVVDLRNGHGFVDEPYTAVVTVRDQFGRSFQERARVTASVVDIESDAHTVLFPATVSERGSGSYEVSFKPEISATYGLAIVLNGTPLQGSPFKIKIRNDETIAGNCRLYGPGLTLGTAGQRNQFYIQAVDGKTQARAVGGDKFQVSIAGPVSAEQLQPVVSDNSNGTYNVSWSTTVAGDYLITAKLEGYIVGGCPVSCTVQAAKTEAANCTASGEGLSKAQAGIPAAFQIKAVDCYGNRRNSGGDAFDVLVKKAGKSSTHSAVRGRVEDSGEGLYKASYVANFAGTYEVHVTAGGKAISGSPFMCHVSAGDVDAGNSRLFGPGLQAVQLGRESQLFCELADAFGNKVESAAANSADLKVLVKGPAPTTVTPGATREGLHTFTYCARSTGVYTISALIGDQHMSGSPAEVEASTAQAHAPHCEVVGAPLTLHTTAGEQAAFTVVAKDQKGVRKSLGGDTFALSWTRAGSNNPPHAGRMEDLGTGEYAGGFSAMAAGAYSISVTFQGTHIAGSPFAAEVAAADVDARASSAAGDGLVSARSGRRAVFVVRAADRFGNSVAAPPEVPGMAGFKADVTGSQAVKVSWDAAGRDSHELTGSFTPHLAGTCHLAITYGGAHIQGSPWTLEVKPDAGHAAHSTVGAMPPHLTVGKAELVTVTARDAAGNATAGGDRVEVMLDSAAEGHSSLPVTDNRDGTYTAKLRPLRSGLISLSAHVNGELVGLPQTLAVGPGPLASLVPAQEHPPHCIAGERVVVALWGFDEHGNPAAAAGPEAVTAELRLHGSSGAANGPVETPESIPLEVRARPHGGFEASAILTVACNFEVVAAVSGSKAGVAVNGTCTHGPVCVSKCVLEQQPTNIPAGEQGHMKIRRMDRFGNRAAGGGGLAVAGRGPGHLSATVHDCGDGTCEIRYKATKAGRYQLTVMGADDGDALPGSPFTVDVAVGPAAAAQSVAGLRGCETGCVEAGQKVVLDFQPRDSLGNVVESAAGVDAVVEAVGPAAVAFAAGSVPTQRVGTLEAAGAYLLHVRLGGAPVLGWPRVLHVLPAPADFARCRLDGEALQGLVVGQPAKLTLATRDRFGNACASGGEDVDVELHGPAGAGSWKASTSDNGNGTYAVTFKVDRAGPWVILPKVGGQSIKEGGYEVSASFGHLVAEHCAVVGGDSGPVVCGAGTDFLVQPHDRGTSSAPRKLSVPEALSATITGPSGCGRAIAASLADGGGAYKVAVPWSEVGRHTVAITLHGAHVAGSPFTVDAITQEVSLASCVFEGDGLSACVAGSTASFRLRACDARGYTVASATADFTLTVVVDGKEISGGIVNHGEGNYEASYVVTRAGEYQLVVGLAGDPANSVFRGECAPGPVSPAHCEVQHAGVEIAAGQAGQLRFWTADRFGNRVLNPLSQAAFGAEGSGPGTLTASVVRASDAELAVHYSADVAGRYSLVVRCSSTGEVLKGSPFAIGIAPGLADAAKSSATIEAAGRSERRLEAGQELVVAIQLRDSFGNPTATTGEGSEVKVVANGPQSVQFINVGYGRHSATLVTAGSYVLTATFGGKLASGWPKPLEVVPARVGKLRASIKGDALYGTICGRDYTLTLTTADQFGNPRSEGGDKVEAVLHHADGKHSVLAAVVDNTNGAYSLAFRLELQGEWRLTPHVNGADIAAAAIKIQAAYGPLTAAECVMLGGDVGSLTCGWPHRLFIQPVLWGNGGRVVSGHEAVMVTVQAPSGTKSLLPLALVDGAGRYTAVLTCSEVGKHKVSAMLNDALLPGCPYTISASATEVALGCCQASGSGLASALAGQVSSFRIAAHDANGNPIMTGGAKFSVKVACEGEEVAGQVTDTSDGWYAAAYRLTRAGKFIITLELAGAQGAPVTYDGVCSPASTAAAKCVVSEAETRITAGQPASLRVTRFDRFGNRISSSEGQPPLSADAHGPGTLSTQVVDYADGSSAVYYSATAAGEYSLALRCAGDDTLLGGALLPVAVLPAPVAVSRCRAVLKGAAAEGRCTAGEEVAAQLQLRDQYGNPAEAAADAPLAVEATGAADVKFEAAPGCVFWAVPIRAGSYVIRATVGGHNVPGWPQPLHVEAGLSDAAQCWLTGPPLQGVTCGTTAVLTLHTADAYGNVRTAGGEVVSASHAAKGSRQNTPTRIKDNGNGTYALRFTLAAAGDHMLHALVGGEAVKGAAHPLAAEYGPLTAAQCHAVLQGGGAPDTNGHVAATCGPSQELLIEALDMEAGRAVSGQEAVTVQLISPTGAAATVPVELADAGTRFRARWRWVEVGVQKVAVTLDGAPVRGSPFAVYVRAGPLHAPACQLLGLDDHRAAAGGAQALTFEVAGRDAYANACPLAPGDVTLACSPAHALADVAITPNASPSVVVVKATVACEGSLKVLVRGEAVHQGAAVPLHVAGGAGCGLHWLAPPPHLTAGRPATLLVETRDAAGHRIQHGGCPVRAQVSSEVEGAPAAAPVRVVERGSGLHELTFHLDTAGPYTISAGIAGAVDSVVSAQGACAPGPPFPAACTFDAATLRGWTAARPGRLHVRLADRSGNVLPPGQGVAALAAHGKGPGPVTATVSPNASGGADVAFVGRAAGPYLLSLADAASGKAFPGSPLQVELLAGPVHAPACSYAVSGSTSGGATVAAGAPLRLAVTARDAFGNLASLPAGALRAAAAGPQGTVHFEVEASSTSGAGSSAQLRLVATVTQAGSYALSVAVTDSATKAVTHIPARGSPSHVTVVPGPLSARHSAVQGIPSSVTAGVPADFAIIPSDQYGNRGAAGGKFLAGLICGEDTVAVHVVEREVSGSRAAFATLTATHAGPWGLGVYVQTADGQSLKLAEAEVLVREAPTAAAESYATGYWPETGAVAGVPAGFIIQACDEYGNMRQSGGDRFHVEVRGVVPDAVSVADRGDGSYKVDYCVPSEGTYTLTTTLGGTHIRGSPMSLTVFRDIGALAGQEMELRLADSVGGLRRGLAQARELQAALRGEAAQLEAFIPVLIQGAASGISDALKQQEDLLAESRAAYQREAVERRRLHNLVQELRGNIRVYVRAKPLTVSEKAAGLQPVVRCESDHRVSLTFQGAPKAFEFDRVFGPNSRQEEVFADASQLVISALDGYNVCIFAYGQTGAGKTYTMEGVPSDPGINYRTMKELFRSIEEDRATDTNYEISCSIVEIYNEAVHDLLAEQPRAQVELQKTATGFDIPGLTTVEVTSPEQIFDIMAAGFEHRAVGCHDINAHSSRSHCLLIVGVHGTNISTGVRTVGKLTLCDLAGSERINKTGATGLTLTEAQNINRSLLELGNVISALMQTAPHVPYRNSKLTMLLQDSLGGDAKALMFCNVAPVALHAGDTFSSLNFASKVSNVVLKTPQRKFEEVVDAGARPQPLSAAAPQPAAAPRTPASPAPVGVRRIPSGVASNGSVQGTPPPASPLRSHRPQWSGAD